MSLLDRARRFVACKRTALVIVPLAAALTAQAEVIFQVTGGGASGVHGPSGGGGRLVSFNALSSPLPSFNGVQGVKLYGDAVWDAWGFDLNLNWVGTVTRAEEDQGPFRIPWQWNFSVQQQGGAVPFLGYRLLFSLGVQQFESRVAFNSPQLTFTATGSDAADFDVAFPGEGWSMDLDLFTDIQNITVPIPPGSTMITLLVPENSVDINPTPEPGSMALLSAGAGLLMILRRKT